MKQLEQTIQQILTTCPCQQALLVRHLPSGRQFALNPDQLFPAASMIKLPIMYEVMRQASQGLLALEELLEVTEAVRVGGAGILQELRPGIALTVQELVTLMIVISDNTATNLLLNRIGLAAVNSTAEQLGLTNTVLRRRMMDFSAARAGQENHTSAADIAKLLEIMYQQTTLPPEYGELMLNILKRQQIRDKLPFYLPEDIAIAHKTGTLDGVEHDAGILFSAGGPYLISVMTAGLPTNYQGLQLVAQIGRAIFEYSHTPSARANC